MVGSLMYAILRTRPNLAFSVSIASRYYSNPTAEHVEQLKRIVRYVIRTLDSGLEFSRKDDLVSYSNTEYTRDRSDSKSIRGYTFTIGGTTIS